MGPPPAPGQDAIRIAERLIQLLDRGGFTATYKYAVLVAILDLCMELTGASGVPPDMITTRQLAEKVVELYWPHCAPYPHGAGARVLRQNTGKPDTQAEIIRHILEFRAQAAKNPAASLSLTRARAGAGPGAYAKLVDTIEWKLVEMPLWRLQRVDREEDRFLYDHGFSSETSRKQVSDHQRGKPSSFDNRLNLKPGVSAALIALNGVLRPLVHRQWALMVARMNNLDEPRLEEFLFGAERISLAPVRESLRELQDNRCFYCQRPLPDDHHVDHFIPWSRHADNSLENLVAADGRCNGSKRDYLASAEHVARWCERSVERAADLARIAVDRGWELQPKRSLRVASAVYNLLPRDTPLWHRGETFVEMDGEHIAASLASALQAA